MKSVLEAAKTGDWKQVSPQTIEAAKFWPDGNTGDNILHLTARHGKYYGVPEPLRCPVLSMQHNREGLTPSRLNRKLARENYMKPIIARIMAEDLRLAAQRPPARKFSAEEQDLVVNAAKTGDWSKVSPQLLEDTFEWEVYWVDEYGNNLLHIAEQFVHAQEVPTILVRLLLLTQKNKNGESPTFSVFHAKLEENVAAGRARQTVVYVPEFPDEALPGMN